MEFPNQTYSDYDKEIEIEHQNLRKLYYVLSKYEIGVCKEYCNSLIHKCLYYQEPKIKDTILKIASFCK